MTRYLRPSLSIPSPYTTSSSLLRFTSPRITDLARSYATHSDLGRGPSTSSKPSRKNITVLSDDGRLQWGDLSGREKVSRATQQSFNFVVVLAGAVLTVRSLPVLLNIRGSRYSDWFTGWCFYITISRSFFPKQHNMAVREGG